MTVRSERLALARVASGGTNVVLYTTPAGKTAILKTVTLYTSSATPGPASLTITASGVPGRRVIFGRLMDPNVSREIVGFVVMHAGDVLECSNGSSGNLDVSVSGAELLGVSP